MPCKPNEGKNLVINTPDFGEYERHPIRTHVIMDGDVLEDILDKYVKDYLLEGDTIFISEKIVAISQGRAFKIDELKVSRLAKIMCKFVHKSDYGIGIGSPETMELCLRSVGRFKVIWAGIAAAVCKLFGKRGVFYNICGPAARAIDGPCDYTIPPYNNYAKMAPDKPHEVAKRLADYIGNDVVIIDANDIGVNILGKCSQDMPDSFGEQIFRDNPLDQCAQQTPIAIIRKVASDTDALDVDSDMPSAT